MTALRKSVLRADNPRETKASELVISIANQVIEHALGEKIKCEHCRDLLQHLQQHWCERCGKETDRLDLCSHFGSDTLLCPRCYQLE